MGKNTHSSSLVETRLARVDPWAVGRSTFLVASSLGVIFLLATGLTWYLVDSLGVWARINSTLASVVGDDAAFSVEKYLSLKNSMIISALLTMVNVIGATILAIVSSFLFNAWAAIFRGPTVSLALPTPAFHAGDPDRTVDSPDEDTVLEEKA